MGLSRLYRKKLEAPIKHYLWEFCTMRKLPAITKMIPPGTEEMTEGDTPGEYEDQRTGVPWGSWACGCTIGKAENCWASVRPADSGNGLPLSA